MASASSRHKGITDGKTGPKLKLRPSDASAAALMAEAREEAVPTIAALTAIRDDPTATPSARVAAGRSLLDGDNGSLSVAINHRDVEPGPLL